MNPPLGQFRQFRRITIKCDGRRDFNGRWNRRRRLACAGRNIKFLGRVNAFACRTIPFGHRCRNRTAHRAFRFLRTCQILAPTGDTAGCRPFAVATRCLGNTFFLGGVPRMLVPTVTGIPIPVGGFAAGRRRFAIQLCLGLARIGG